MHCTVMLTWSRMARPYSARNRVWPRYGIGFGHVKLTVDHPSISKKGSVWYKTTSHCCSYNPCTMMQYSPSFNLTAASMNSELPVPHSIWRTACLRTLRWCILRHNFKRVELAENLFTSGGEIYRLNSEDAWSHFIVHCRWVCGVAVCSVHGVHPVHLLRSLEVLAHPLTKDA